MANLTERETRQNVPPEIPLEDKKDQSSLLSPFTPQSTMSFGAINGFYRINSTEKEDNSRAIILSSSGSGFYFDWQLNWSQKLSSNFRFLHRRIDFYRASPGVLEEGKQALTGMVLDFQNHWTPKFSSFLSINFDERIFVSSPRSGIAQLGEYHQPSLGLGLSREILNSGPLSLDLGMKYRHYLQTSTETSKIYDSGEYQVGAIFRQKLKKFQLELKFHYFEGEQKSTYTIQENTGLEALLGLRVGLGDDEN